MKTTIIVVMVGLFVLLGVYTLKQSVSAQPVIEPSSYLISGHCRNRTVNQSYEWYYLHLSNEDQAYVDLELLRQLDLYDFDLLSDVEKQNTLNEIKENMVAFIIEEELYLSRNR